MEVEDIILCTKCKRHYEPDHPNVKPVRRFNSRGPDAYLTACESGCESPRAVLTLSIAIKL